MSDHWKPGEPISASKLNRNSASTNSASSTGQAGFSRSGASFASTQADTYPESYWVAITEAKDTGVDPNFATDRTIWRHSWVEVTFDPIRGAWRKNPSKGGYWAVDPVYDPDPTTKIEPSQEVTIGESKEKFYEDVYSVTRDPYSGWLVAQGGSSRFTAKAQDLTVLILGDYDTYKDCAALACMPLPPHTGSGANITLCQPAYAWAAYKVCGYNYLKQFDIRGLKRWALELNGGTGTVNRMHIPRWGWDTYTDGPPNLNANATSNTTNGCVGVKFLGHGAGALSCGCPTWLSEVSCFKIKIKYLAEADVDCIPGNTGCGCDTAEWTCFTDKMASLWGTEEEITLCSIGGCDFQGDNTGALFNFTLAHQMIPSVDEYGNCFYGPSLIEPCNLCDGFARVLLGVSASSTCGGGQGGAYSHFWLDQGTIRSLVEDCTKGPIRMNFAGHRSQIEPGNACPNVIEWIEISCCNQNEINNCVAAENP